MNPSLLIRPATPADALCIAVLGMQVFLDTYATKGVWPSLAREAAGDFSAATIEQQMAQPGAFFLVAEQGDCLLGFAHLFVSAKRAGEFVVTRLYVQEPFTGKGVGKALLDAAEKLVRDKAGSAISLTAWAENARARAFYERQGYDDVGPSTYTFENDSYPTRRFLKRLS